jgi:uncharacterized damage-inducible protein DinB
MCFTRCGVLGTLHRMAELWLRGPVEGVDPLLMPAAHALLQTMEDAQAATADLSAEELWQKPGTAAPVGFHLKHLTGSTDRLLTYARGERLNDAQKAVLADEKSAGTPLPDAATLLGTLRSTIDAAIDQLRATDAATLQEPRQVGRAAASTVIGLIFHAAEHAQRHAGQIVTTVKILRGA